MGGVQRAVVGAEGGAARGPGPVCTVNTSMLAALQESNRQTLVNIDVEINHSVLFH